MTELYYYLGLVALLIVGWFALNATTTYGHVLERRARWIILGFFVRASSSKAAVQAGPGALHRGPARDLAVHAL